MDKLNLPIGAKVILTRDNFSISCEIIGHFYFTKQYALKSANGTKYVAIPSEIKKQF